MNEEKNKGGRPLIFKTVEELEDAIKEYFAFCDNRMKTIYHEKLGEIAVSNPAPYTVSGLARALDTSRQTLINYSKRDKFFDTIQRAKVKIEEDVETRLLETRNEKGAKFSLTNNFGWREKTEVDHTTKGDKLPTPIYNGRSVETK